MIGRNSERGSGISVLAARHDDDDDDIYIYINMAFVDGAVYFKDGVMCELCIDKTYIIVFIVKRLG